MSPAHVPVPAPHRRMLLGALLLLSGCSVFQAPGGGVNLISVSEEWEMGDRFAAEIDQQMEVISHPQADKYLTNLGQKLLRASTSELAELPWTFKLIKDDSVNAFAIPGGHVYIHTGLVMALSNEAELASVVGHEIGHGLYRHGTRQMTKQLGISAVLSLALGEDPGKVESLVAGVGAQSALLKFGRDDELEADRIGTFLMYGAGWDPQGTVDMLKVLASLQEREPSRMERFLSSHPAPSTRIGEAEERIAALPPRTGLIEDSNHFRTYQWWIGNLDD